MCTSYHMQNSRFTKVKLEVKEKSHDNIVILKVAHWFPHIHLFVTAHHKLIFSVFDAARSHDNMIMELSVRMYQNVS